MPKKTVQEEGCEDEQSSQDEEGEGGWGVFSFSGGLGLDKGLGGQGQGALLARQFLLRQRVSEGNRSLC